MSKKSGRVLFGIFWSVIWLAFWLTIFKNL